jgi:hypothetical protein
MNAARLEKIRKSLERIALWIGALTIVFVLLDYSLDVSKRLSREPACTWDLVENLENEPYVARYCHLTKDTVMVRLYDAKEEDVLAERMYFEQNMAKIYWTPDGLLYDTSIGGVISLPPTLIDRLRAKLP